MGASPFCTCGPTSCWIPRPPHGVQRLQKGLHYEVIIAAFAPLAKPRTTCFVDGARAGLQAGLLSQSPFGPRKQVAFAHGSRHMAGVPGQQRWFVILVNSRQEILERGGIIGRIAQCSPDTTCKIRARMNVRSRTWAAMGE